MKFNKKYFISFIILFITEVLIAKYATGFLRHTIGDVLVVILLYCFIKSFIKASINKTLLLVLIVAFIVEFLQLSNLQNIYPKKFEQIFKIILGTSFSIIDLFAYLTGIVIIYLIERNFKNVF